MACWSLMLLLLDGVATCSDVESISAGDSVCGESLTLSRIGYEKLRL